MVWQHVRTSLWILLFIAVTLRIIPVVSSVSTESMPLSTESTPLSTESTATTPQLTEPSTLQTTTEAVKYTPGQPCNASLDNCIQNATCAANNTCQCIDSHYYDGNKDCKPKLQPGENCNDTDNCLSSFVCQDSVCKIPAGGDCKNYNHCVTNTTCENGTCKIPSVCESDICKIPAGSGVCNNTNQCVTNAVCDQQNCKIPAGGGDCNNTNQCVTETVCEQKKCKIDAGKTGCNDSAQCVSNTTCQSGTCKINAGSGGCNNNNNNNECVINATCQNGSCRWIYGSQCQQDGECANNLHEECSTSRCLCFSDYFRDGGQCIPVSYLSAWNITNIVLQEKNISVKWERPNISLNADEVYMVTISSSGFEKQTPWLKNLFADFTNLTEGTRYSVTVTTKRPKDPFPGSVLVEFNATAVFMYTKPAKPGQLIQNEYSVKNIVLTFTASAGHTDNYTVTVSNIRLIVQNSQADLNGKGLAAGQSYNVTIVAVSYEYTSDPMTDTFTVSAERAGEVYQLNTSNRGSRFIWVTYQRPRDANGVIMGYTVTAQTEDRCVSAVIISCNDCGSNATNSPNVSNCAAMKTIEKNQTYLDMTTEIVKVNLTSLLPDVTYNINVIAFNQLGKGIQATNISKTEIEGAKNLRSLNIIKHDVGQLQAIWESGERTGPTNYTITLEEETKLNSGVYVFNNTFQNEGYYNTTYIISNLLSYWNYSITVQPYTALGPSPENMTRFQRTVESEPGVVESLQADPSEETATKATLQFRCPPERQRNGNITSYNYTSIVISDKMTNPTIPNGGVRPENNCEFSVPINVTAETSYIISVFAVTGNLTGERLNHTLTIGSKPPKLSTPPDTKLVSEVGATTDSVTVKICRCAVNRDEGIIKLAGLIVCVQSPSEKCEAGTETNNATYYDRLPTWHKFQEKNFVGRYRPTPTDWHTKLEKGEDSSSRRRRAVSDASENVENMYQYIIGENHTCNQQNASVYCNGQLPANKDFIIIVWACTSAGCTESSDPIKVKTVAEAQSETQVGAIVGGIIGALAVIALIVVAVFMFRRSRFGRTKPPIGIVDSIRSRIIRLLQQLNKDTVSVDDTFQDLSWIPETMNMRPIKLTDFAAHLDRLHRDSNLLFQEEFEDVQESVPANGFTQEAALLDANKIKNRYVNILPYDQTRVKLIADDDDETADFINANYIPGFSSPREYIATQGPMMGTIIDFWRMIWEQNSLQIVMLSDLQERGRPKVDQYWPSELNSAIQYGDIIVEMTSHSTLNRYTIRTFQIFKENYPDDNKRVQQYFIPGWEDYSANLNPDDVIDFIRTVRRDARPFTHGPITVHCSAGVGRTGTFIALDFLMQFVDKNDLDAEVDIYNLVLNMRRNRPYMVQSERQYIFIHDTLKIIIEKKIERMQGQNDPIYGNSVEDNIYANQGFEPEEENLYENSEYKKPTTTL